MTTARGDDVDLESLDRDALKEAFEELERELQEHTTDDLERRFADLERRSRG